MKKLWLAASLIFVSLSLLACGGGGPTVTHLGVMLTGTATAGTAFPVTITAVDSHGNVVTSYMATVQITSSDARAQLPGTATLVNGSATVQVILGTAGNQSITATNSVQPQITGMGSVSVNPGPAGQFTLAPDSSSVTAGTPFHVKVTAIDAFTNTATSYTGTVHLTSTDGQGVLPGDMQLSSGVGIFPVTLKTAGTQTMTATDTSNPSLIGTTVVTINAGTATHISVSGPAAATTTLAFMATVSAADSFGNPDPTYTGTVKFTSSDAQATLPMNSTLTSGTGMFSVTLVTLGPQTITAADTVMASLKGTSNSINVVTNVATHISVTGPTSSLTRQTIQMTVSALDAANNTSMVYTGTVHFTSSDAQAKLPADSTLTAGTGNFPVTFETAGTDSVTATDTVKSSITGMASVTVTAAAALAITSGNPPNGQVGQRYDPQFILVCFGRFCHRTLVYGFPLGASGGVPPYIWSWAPAPGSSVPPGLAVADAPNNNCPLAGFRGRPHQGCIFGTPIEPSPPNAPFNVVLSLTDSGLPAAQPIMANYTISIALPPTPVVNATPASIPGLQNIPFSFTFTATGYPPFTWNESGAVPGLTFDSSTGTLSGTPTQTGTFPISVTATDQFKQTSPTANFTVAVTVHGFVATGSMGTARRFHTATLLGNGKVLIAGGEDAGSNAFATAELYDPATGMFTPTAHNMTVARVGHTATLLNNGQVLITGGATDGTEAATATAELYDPVADTFTATTGAMMAARVVHTATLLQTGKVLIAGGDVIFFNGNSNAGIMSLNTAEIFDPGTGTFTKTGDLTVPRESHTATLLNSGKVLLAGGSDGALGNSSPTATLYATADLFDPSTGTFTATGTMTTQRDFQTANLLNSGKVLVAGGAGNAGTNASADLFDPSSGSFAATGALTEPRFYQDASTLNDGTVLVTGGSDTNTRAKATAEIYNPNAGTFAVTGNMNAARVWHTSTLLQNGKVLVTGGADINSSPLATAELYQ